MATKIVEIDDILQLLDSGPVPIKYRSPMTHVEVYCPWCTEMVGKVKPSRNFTVIVRAEKCIVKHLKAIGVDAPCNRYEATGMFRFPRPMHMRERWEGYGMKFDVGGPVG